MKRRLVRFFLLCIGLALLFSTPAPAQDFPAKAGVLVSDYSGTLSAQERAALEQKLVAFDDSTSTQIAVVIMRSVGTYDINDYAARLGEHWGVGQKGKNNGVVLLVAKEDRDVAIQVGYGLEPVLTDALTKRVIETVIVPSFKQGDFYGGIDKATDVLMSVAAGEFTAADYVGRTKQKEKPKDNILFYAMIFGLIILFTLFTRGRSVSRYARNNNLGFWAALALMNSMSSRHRGSWGSFSSGSGAFGGGGFGGFGGGSFGGGGSSGSW